MFCYLYFVLYYHISILLALSEAEVSEYHICISYRFALLCTYVPCCLCAFSVFPLCLLPVASLPSILILIKTFLYIVSQLYIVQ